LSISALVAGSFAPDLGYYFGRFDLASLAHSPTTGLLFAVPAGMLLLVAWRALGPVCCEPLPRRHRRVLSVGFEPLAHSPRAVLATTIAIAIGAATHIAWDSFTHAHGLFVYYSPAMRVPVQLGNGIALPRYRLLQHLSTAVGVAVLTIAYLRALRRERTGDRLDRLADRRRAALLAALALLALAASCVIVGLRFPHAGIEELVFRLTVSSTLLFAMLLAGAGIRIRAVRRRSAR
jgi:hypothetical protein